MVIRSEFPLTLTDIIDQSAEAAANFAFTARTSSSCYFPTA